jgi:phosphopantetheinyl transferase (holo-ACP synthase)
MTVRILDRAENDLVAGYWFYEAQLQGLGTDFREALYSDIGGLEQTGGIHRVVYKKYHRALAKRFPFAVFYTLSDQTVWVHAVVDCRREPTWITEHLT